MERKRKKVPHPDFVYLDDIAPTIRQDIRYASAGNFTSQKLPGYIYPTAILRRPVALALKQAQSEFLKCNFTLIVLDAYRPQRAVNMMVEWAERTDPNLLKDDYISKTSHHSRGIAVDLTLAKINPQKSQSNNYQIMDMGSQFDEFSKLSHTQNLNINSKQQQLRNLLVTIMQKHGFKNYHREWWHFTYARQNFPNIRYDFPIRG